MKINISSERAGQILREWQEQKTTLVCTLGIGEVAGACLESAQITELGANVLLSGVGNPPTNRMMFCLTGVTFAHADLEDMRSDKIIGTTRTAKSQLFMTAPWGRVLWLAELVPVRAPSLTSN